MKRDLLSPGRIYTESLEEVLGLKLDADSLHAKVARRQIESIGADVRALSDALTGQHGASLQRRYLAKANFQRAYRLYYTTTNFLKILPPLYELRLGGAFDQEALSVLDLGTGTGAAIWGLVQFVEEELRRPIRIVVAAVDAVAENLNFVRAMGRSVATRCEYAQLEIETKLLDIRGLNSETFASERFDLVTMMNTLNELDHGTRSKLLEIVPNLLSEAGSCLLIEPAAKIASRGLLEFRDAAVRDGLTVYAPCTRQSKCPALEVDDDWCHNEYDWERPAFVRIVDEVAGLVRLSVKSSYCTLNRSGATLGGALHNDAELWRVVSGRSDEKGRVRATCCGEHGKSEVILNKRDKSVSNKPFLDIERFDLISASSAEHREHDIMLTEASSVRVVLPILGAR